MKGRILRTFKGIIKNSLKVLNPGLQAVIRFGRGASLSQTEARPRRSLLLSVSLVAVFSSPIFASGYKMEFQSPSVLADAGEAAVVEDAGTNWYNSAGLVYLPQQLTFSAIDVYAPTTFTGTMIAPSAFGSSFVATGSASSHPNTFLPAFHYALPLNKGLALGLSVVPAWGFLEDYGSSSLVRYDLTRVYTRTLDIAPSVSLQINDCWSVGLGPDFHYMAVQSRSSVRTQFATLSDSISRFSVDSWGYGFHAGVLYRLSDATRIGLNYRSKIVMNMDGWSEFLLTGIQGFSTHTFNLKIPLPPTTTLSAYHDINCDWAIMGTLAYDQWSVLSNYHAQNVIQPAGILPDVISPQHMHNTVDVSVGAHYRLNNQWLFRGSIKYEPTPTINAYRDINFPDGVKLGLNIGTRYQMLDCLALDLIYGHVFVRRTSINGFNALSQAQAIGHNKTTIDLFGGQLVWNI